MQHPEYEAIIAECEPWLLDLVAPPTAAAAQFWKDSLLPLLGSFMFANCPKERAVLATKMLIWFTVSDTADDDLAVRGCAVTDHVRRRHDLILAYGTGNPLNLDVGANVATREFLILQDIWEGISKGMPLAMQSRYRQAVDQYLHALRVQARYRNTDSLPTVDEYLNVVRRPASICLQLIILLEYALDIELDEETLRSELILQLHDAVAGHGGLYNDLFSYESEIFSGDYLNLPSVIFHAGIAAQPAGFTFADAVQQAVMMAQEVDRRCAQLMEDIKKSGLIKKPGVEAYLRGLGPFMAGNVEWSYMTARYTHTCSMEGLVVPIERRPLSLPTSVAPAPPPPPPASPPVPIL